MIKEVTSLNGTKYLQTETRIGKYLSIDKMSKEQLREWNSLTFKDRLRIRTQEHFSYTLY